jgi:hypothetical protein
MATGNQVKAVIPAPKAGEGTEGETRAARAAPVHRRRFGARTRPGGSGGAPNRERAQPQSRKGRAGLKRAQLELSVIESQLRLRGLLER